jgi:hypothetical protein
MRRMVTSTIVAVLLVGGSMTATHAAQPMVKSFASCVALQKDYPNGVARDAKARAKALQQGLLAPRVSKPVYLKNARKLDRDGDGIMCPRKAPGGAASVDPVAPPYPEYAAIANAV